MAVEDVRTARLGLDHAVWRRAGLFWLTLAVGGMTMFFWDGILRVLQGWTRPEYSFGPLVPVVSAYMLLHELRERPPISYGGSRIPGLLVVGLGLFIGFLGNLTQISHVIAYGLLVVVGGLVLILAGFRQGITYWPGWVHLTFMLPLPSFIYHQVSRHLQFISSEIGVKIVQLVGIPVYLSVNIIDLGIYQLHVAEACSGLRYLFPLMSFGYLFAVLYRGPLWQKLVLFFLSIPITILMNSIRIGVIGILVNYFGIAQAEGFLHWFEGWVIFLACIILLYAAGLVLQRLRSKPETALNILDLEFNGLLTPITWLRNLTASPALVAAAVAITLAGAMWQFTPSRAAPSIERLPFDAFPMTMGEWNGQRGKLDETVLQVLKADEYILADFSRTAGEPPVNFFVAYYYSITDGTDTHSPEFCLPGGGWEISRWQTLEVDPGGGVTPFELNRAVMRMGSERQLVYFWYEQRGHRFSSSLSSKINTVIDAATLGRSEGSLVRLITPLPPGQSDAKADKRLQQFLATMTPKLTTYMPE